jgi:hypothetical protein
VGLRPSRRSRRRSCSRTRLRSGCGPRRRMTSGAGFRPCRRPRSRTRSCAGPRSRLTSGSGPSRWTSCPRPSRRTRCGSRTRSSQTRLVSGSRPRSGSGFQSSRRSPRTRGRGPSRCPSCSRTRTACSNAPVKVSHGSRRAWKRRVHRRSVVYLGVVLPVVTGNAHLTRLHGHGAHAPLVLGSDLSRCGASLNPTASAVEADPAFVVVVPYHRAVLIGVVDHRRIYMHHGSVVVEVVSLPAPAVEAFAVIPIPVIDAAIEANLWAPVAVVPRIAPVVPTPVAGRPQQTGLRRRNPGSRNPVVVVVAPGPVAGAPQIIWIRANRLIVNRQLGRRDGDGHADLSKGDAGRHKQRGNEESISKPAKKSHRASFGPCFRPSFREPVGALRWLGGGRAIVQLSSGARKIRLSRMQLFPLPQGIFRI